MAPTRGGVPRSIRGACNPQLRGRGYEMGTQEPAKKQDEYSEALLAFDNCDTDANWLHYKRIVDAARALVRKYDDFLETEQEGSPTYLQDAINLIRESLGE